MTELHLALSFTAVQALAQGNELVFDVDDGDEKMRVMLRCDDVALKTFKARIESALLHMLPADPKIH